MKPHRELVSIYCDQHPDRVAVLYQPSTGSRLCQQCKENR